MVICILMYISAYNPTHQNAEEKSTQWIIERLAESLEPLSTIYEDINVLNVEPCRIVLAFSAQLLSGSPVLEEIEIRTDDILVRENGEFLCSEWIVSNCSPVGEDRFLFRRIADAFRIRASRISAEEWTGLFRELNEQCMDEYL